MKNIFSLFIIIFIALVIFTSCSKPTVVNTITTTDTTHVYDTVNVKDTFRFHDTTVIKDTIQHPITIVGYYTGKIGNNSDYPSFQLGFLFRADGTVRAYNNNITTPGYADTSTIPPAEGTYTVSGDTVRTTCTYLNNPSNTFSTIALIDSANTYMEGSWGPGTLYTGGGYFFVYKQF
jgi:hypothetical protein